MSQNPLASIRRVEPRRRGEFPDALYADLVLDPLQRQIATLLQSAAVEVYTAHAILLGETRIVEPNTVAGMLEVLARVPEGDQVTPHHPLSQLEARVIRKSSPELLHARAREEITLAAMRIVLRERLLAFAEATIELRETIAQVAGGNLTTLLLATANGQVVGPTSLGHYLAGQIAPLERTSERLRGAFARLNQSPLGAVSGLSTAMPVQRDRAAELLGFDGIVASTFDAIGGADALVEPLSIASLAALESSRLVADLTYWARDDVGLLTPGDEFVHAPDVQPQRRDPLVLAHLRARLAQLAAAPGGMVALQIGRQMLGSDATQFATFFEIERQLLAAVETYRLLAAVLRTAVVNRSLFAHRALRGFSTSSELADLLAIDFQLPREQANALAERVVVEATEQGGEATTLRPELIDRIALRQIGRELGIDPEVLARCLSPKRFVERRDATGGPSPRAVSAALDGESLALRRERAWLESRVQALENARRELVARRDGIIALPESVFLRPQSAGGASERDADGDRIGPTNLT
jgi:argininosuccinate lyase